jgi:hypothetical protein
MGSQTCVQDGENVAWGTCVGSGQPQPVQCGSGVDYACTGNPNQGCACIPGETQSCYSGPAGTAGHGLCVAGQQTCNVTAAGPAWSVCVGEVTPVPDACDGRDQDCNGSPDTACRCTLGATRSCYSGPAGTAGQGRCVAGTQTCTPTPAGPDWGACTGEITPTPEACDGVDHDCNGEPDTGCGCTVGQTQACYSGPAATQGVGQCVGGTQVCQAIGPGVSAFGPCQGERTPQTDRCDGVDADCDGNPATGCACTVGAFEACYSGPPGTQGVGTCAAGFRTCLSVGGAPAAWSSCVGEVLPTATQMCDGQDRMCNNQPAQGCTCAAGATEACYSGPPATQGVGLCHAGTRTCQVLSGSLQWGACQDERTPAAAETCGNNADETCNGQNDEGCASIQCSADMTVNAGTVASVQATGAGITNVTWVVVAQPTGAGSSAEWNPGPSGSTAGFRPYIVGVYTLEARGQDAQGRPQSCQVNVTAQAHGLRVELTWDGFGDVDLHLHNNENTRWFGADDCYYGNCVAPREVYWDARLDVDNVTSDGPENINLDFPGINEDYVIGIHNYARASGRTPVVKVYCGLTANGITPQAVYTGPVLQGGGNGDCTGNTFWRVVKVRFPSPGSCTLTPINTTTSSNDACDHL